MFYLFDQVPIRQTSIALLFRAAMQGDVFRAAVCSELCRFYRINGVIVKAGANLDRHRNRNSPFDFFQDSLQPLVIFQQSRSTAVLYNLRRGTAAIHVENVCANFFGQFGGHAHAFRLAAKNLHRERPLVFIKAHLPF